MDSEILKILSQTNIFEALKSIKYNYGDSYKLYISNELYFLIGLKYIQEYRKLSKEDRAHHIYMDNIKFLFSIIKSNKKLFIQCKNIQFTDYYDMLNIIKKLVVFS